MTIHHLDCDADTDDCDADTDDCDADTDDCDADTEEAEDAIQQWASDDHGTHYTVAEIVDDSVTRWSRKHGTDIGPMVYGPTDEVEAWLTEQGFSLSDESTTNVVAEALIIDPDDPA